MDIAPVIEKPTLVSLPKAVRHAALVLDTQRGDVVAANQLATRLFANPKAAACALPSHVVMLSFIYLNEMSRHDLILNAAG
ncbi:hypothetical protein [Yoonia sp.]|uniref:hypothetical protein n=1 Tax=Yoonia sp. TaxID=2212373 RepID=UPI003A4D72B0